MASLPMPPSTTHRALLALAAALFTSGCRDRVGPAPAMERQLAIEIQGSTGADVSVPFDLRAEVTDGGGAPVPGAVVQWKIVYPVDFASLAIGDVVPESSRTADSGTAVARATAPVRGTYKVRATTAAGTADSLYVRVKPPAAADLEMEWTRLADMPAGRGYASVAVFAGRIYVVAGLCNPGDLCDKVLIYDPAADSWAVGADGPAVPYEWGGEMAAALTDGIHVIIEGRHSVYDPVSDRWSSRAAAPDTSVAAALEAVNGMLYLIGADHEGGIWIYDPSTDVWSPGSPMPRPIAYTAGSGVLDGQIYVAGEDPGSGENLFERYDPASDAWTELPPVPFPRVASAGGMLGRSFCIFGGFGGDKYIEITNAGSAAKATRDWDVTFPDTYCYDVDAANWRPGPPYAGSEFLSDETGNWPYGGGYIAAATTEDGIYAVGGVFRYASSLTAEVDMYRLSLR